MRISFWFAAGLALFTLLDRSFIAPSLFAVIALHEGAHLAAMGLCGVAVRQVALLPYGARIDANLSAITPRRRAAVYLCAPLLNLALGLGLMLTDPLSMFGVFNLCVGAFNLLPVPPLDGGNAARTLFTSRRGERLLRAAAYACLAAAFAGSIALGIAQGNFSLLVCAVYLAAGLLLEER